jgi:competence protein ComGC
MSHALQLQQRNNPIFIPMQWLNHFLHRRKWILSLLIISVISIFTIPTIIPDTAAVQTETVHASTPTLEDRIVRYMVSINHKLDTDTAYKLAAAIIVESDQYHIPINIQLGMIAVESRFDQFAISNHGALGFYQIMPTVHNDKVVDMYDEGTIDTKNIYDPMTQAVLGNRILHDCLRSHRQNMTRALQCYNGSTASLQYPNDVMKRAEDAKQIAQL